MKRTAINLNVTMDERDRIKAKAKNFGFKNMTDYVRCMCLNGVLEVKLKDNEDK